MFELHTAPTPRTALYCPHSGERIAPSDGSHPETGTTVAVVVFDDGSTFPIFGNTVVGRDPSRGVDMVDASKGGQLIEVSDPTQKISRCHLLLEVVDWQVAAIDVGSSNGTMVTNEIGSWQRIIPGLRCWLSDGQGIMVGNRTFTVHLTGS